MSKATAIRMNGARKNELQLQTAADGHHTVRQAIADGFNVAHKDVENVMLVNGDQPHPQKVGLNGLAMSSYGIGNGRQPNVTHKCEWTQEYIDSRTENHKKRGNSGSPYIGMAGNASVTNNTITDDEGTVQNWGNGFQPSVKYKYAWQPYVEAGLMRFLRLKVTNTLEQSQQPNLAWRNQQQISANIMWVERVLAYLKMDRALFNTEASVLVAKRANPYDHTHFVLRSGSTYGRDTDYSTYELLKLPMTTTHKPIKMMNKAVKLMQSLSDAVNSAVSANRDTTYNAQQLRLYRESLVNYESQLRTQIAGAEGEWGSLEAAIKMDAQQRTEVVDYLKALPHKHLLDMRSSNAITWFGQETEMTTIEPNPRFILGHGLEANIKAREETIERTKQSIRTYEAKVAADASNLGDLKMQVAVGELKQFATAEGWIKPDITGGEEE